MSQRHFPHIGDGFLLFVQEGSTPNDVTYPLSRWPNWPCSSWLTTSTSLAFFTSRSRSTLWPWRALEKKNTTLRYATILSPTSLCNATALPENVLHPIGQPIREIRWPTWSKTTMTRFSVGHLVTNDLETMPGKVGYNVKLCQLIQGASGRMLGHKRGWILAVSCQVISEIGIIVCGTISTCHLGRISVNTGTLIFLPLLLLKKELVSCTSALLWWRSNRRTLNGLLPGSITGWCVYYCPLLDKVYQLLN